MTKKLIIRVSDKVYVGLHRNVGRNNVSRFIDGLLRSQVTARGPAPLRRKTSTHEIARAYAEAAAYEATHAKEIEEADEAWFQELIAAGLGPNRSVKAD